MQACLSHTWSQTPKTGFLVIRLNFRCPNIYNFYGISRRCRQDFVGMTESPFHSNIFPCALSILEEMSRLMRLWHLSPSVNSILKCPCAAIQCGYTSDFRSDSSSTSILYMFEQQRLGRDCADAQSRLSLRCSPMR